MKIIQVDPDLHSGILCLESEQKIIWDDEFIQDALEGSCVECVIINAMPETCAMGGPLKKQWERFYRDNCFSSLEETVKYFSSDLIALKVVQTGFACGFFQQVTYFILPATSRFEWIESKDE